MKRYLPWLAALFFLLGACLGIVIVTLVTWLRDRNGPDDHRQR